MSKEEATIQWLIWILNLLLCNQVRACLESCLPEQSQEVVLQKIWHQGVQEKYYFPLEMSKGFPGGSDGKESTCNAGDVGSMPGSGRFPGEGNGYSSLNIPVFLPGESHGQRNLRATVHGVTKSWTEWLSSSRLRRRQWHPTPVLLLGKSHGQWSLVGCSPWGCEESDTTEWLHFHFPSSSSNRNV